MREILFRGKSKYNGKWYFGDYSSFDVGIVYEDYINEYGDKEEFFQECSPETIGQFTGLTDKNGTRIYEGDILQFEYIGKNLGVQGKEAVIFKNGKVCVEWGTHREIVCLDGFANTTIEVVGNIHDNIFNNIYERS